MAGPRGLLRAARTTPPAARALRFSTKLFPATCESTIRPPLENPLRAYFEAHHEGLGIWKWTHYFDAYHRHLQKFIGRELVIVEVGVFSGGSLQMWRNYLGSQCQVVGIDIDPACAAYRADGIDILIGDQSDPALWKTVREKYPKIDILIDDGSHVPEHQASTLEEMLPHLAPGGVFVTEDIQGTLNYYGSYVAALTHTLNLGTPCNFVSAVDSIHSYPFMVVIEKTECGRTWLENELRGSQWQRYNGGDFVAPIKGN